MNNRKLPQPLNISKIIYPMEFKEFKDIYLSKKTLHLKGNQNKFNHLFNWQSLNEVLNSSLILNKSFVSIESITKQLYVTNQMEIANDCINKNDFTIDTFHNYSSAIRELADKLITELKTNRLNINLYASYPGKPAFYTQFEQDNIIVLQIEGEQKFQAWKQFEVDKHIKGNISVFDNEDARDKFKRVPFIHKKWQEAGADQIKESVNRVMEDEGLEQIKPELKITAKRGDLIYIPPGFWHKVIPGDKPSLHLTIVFSYPRGMDFFMFLKNELINNQKFLNPIPIFLKDETNTVIQEDKWQTFLRTLNTKMDEFLEEEPIFQKFYESKLLNNNLSELFNFPYHYLADIISNSENRMFTQNINEYMVSNSNKDKKFTYRGQSITVDSSFAPLIDYIFNVKDFTLRNLLENLNNIPFNKVLNLLNMLVRSNIIKIIN